MLVFEYNYLTSYIMVQKSVWRSSESQVRLASKRQVWNILFLFEIYDHVSKGKFGPLSQNLNFALDDHKCDPEMSKKPMTLFSHGMDSCNSLTFSPSSVLSKKDHHQINTHLPIAYLVCHWILVEEKSINWINILISLYDGIVSSNQFVSVHFLLQSTGPS